MVVEDPRSSLANLFSISITKAVKARQDKALDRLHTLFYMFYGNRGGTTESASLPFLPPRQHEFCYKGFTGAPLRDIYW